MDTRLTLLGLLSTGPGYGYDLKTHWDRWFAGTKPLAFGQVYATLARLLRDGLIVQLGAETGAGPERKRYEITETGRAAVEEWIRSPEVPSDSIQADLFAKTIIAILLDDDAEHLLDLQRSAHTQRMRELTRRKEGADLHTILIADHALFHLEADLRWIDLTAARLNELRREVRA
ncbi:MULTISPECIES: PadR family transcriptional regulator [unclassified Actinomyces]|uniref:PadR family transcriptional regulator n=1 Tax=unclassified Actinomyces TaxID=2609248 RepID=UPI000D5A01A4|nr:MULTISPECIES: PadR family transcriptional regulator [unclassified Actinomyces]RAX20142.1 PadR family transcriptional regulator [Actinomyces sp. Z3]